MNQLLDKSLLENKIDYSTLEPKHFTLAFEKLIPQVKKEFEEELLLESTYDNLFEKSFKGQQLSQVLSYLNHLNGVVQNDQLRDIFGKYVPQISAMYQEMSLDKRSYEKLVNYTKTEQYTLLSSLRKKMIQDMLLDFELDGIHLPEEKKQRLQEISYRLTELSDQFENNIMDVQKTFEIQLDIKQLKGLPERSLQNIEKLANGKYLVSETSGVYDDILTYCEIEETRRIIYEQQLDLGIRKDYDNRPIVEEILVLRQENAQILGYDNYATYSLKKEMLKSPNEVFSFIEDLAIKSLPQAIEESNQVSIFGEQLLNRKVNFHDRAFVIQKMKEQLYDINSEELRKYFPINKVLSGLFEIVENLYGITFIDNNNISKWHEEVIVYNIYNDKNEDIGILYLDLYKRKNKESGAWMLPKQSNVDNEFEKKKPITYLVLNIPKNQKQESTIELEEIVTLFHEMGHGLHNMLSEVKEGYFSGLSNVEHDAIELPSQFMEKFVWDYEVLKKLSSHIETQQQLPLENFKKIQNAKLFLAANQMVRQASFSYLDMYIHVNNVNAIDIEKEIFNRWKTREIDERSEFLPIFSHIFSGGYAAGYYSYKWSEVLSSDAFEALKEAGNTYLEQKHMANKFRENILSKGGTNNMLDNFIEFRGRKPDVRYLLRDYGIDLKTT